MYSLTSIALNFVKEEQNGKKYGRLQYFGCLVFVVSMLLTGPAPFLEDKISTLCVGVLLAGVGGALINNNSTPAMLLTEQHESQIKLGRDLTTNEKQKL